MENNTSLRVTSVKQECPACGRSTGYLYEGLCLDCAYKKSQIDMQKSQIPAPATYGQAWTCPKCGMTHGPGSQTCWCNLSVTCSYNK